MDASPSSPSTWIWPAITLVVAYRAVMACLSEAFHALTSLHRRRMLEEEGIANPLLVDLLARPHAFGFGITLWNQILFMLLLGLLLPLTGLLPGHGWTLLAILLLYIWAMDLALPALITASAPATWVVRLFPFYGLIHRLFMPLVEPLSVFVERRRERTDRDLEHEETPETAVTALLEEGEAEGILEEGDRELIRNVVEFGDTVVREVMTPRTRFHALASDATSDEIWRAFRESRHSRLPVYQGSVDTVIGVILLKDLLQHHTDEVLTLPELLKPAFFVPESKPVLELLRELQRERLQMAVVVDEYGSVSGLVTIEDLLEEVFGEIREEHEPQSEIQHLSDGSLLVPGAMHIEDLESRLEREWPHEGFDTVAGLVLSRLGRVPQPGDSVPVEGAMIAVTRMEGARILQVRVKPVTASF